MTQVEDQKELEIEYKELCEDWRCRDKYVLDKLGTAGILFALLGLAVGQIPDENPFLKLLLLFLGGLLSLVLAISVAKDTYYRDGTQEFVKSIARRLKITDSLGSLEDTPILEKQYPLEMPRKISIDVDEYVQLPRKSPKLLKGLHKWLLHRNTFAWILWFYVALMLFFLGLFIAILIEWKFEWNLPL